MNTKLTWNEIYDMWKLYAGYLPGAISDTIQVENIFVDYGKKDEYIYGYDWLEETEAARRKKLIKKDPIQFLYFTTPSNKGTIQTAQMLAEAKNDEERAAIWIAATAFELMNQHAGSSVSRYANTLYYAALSFLNYRFYLWHHAMRKLVPDILISYEVLNSIQCNNEQTVIDLIQMNTLLIKSYYRVLLYDSTNGKEKTHSIRR